MIDLVEQIAERMLASERVQKLVATGRLPAAILTDRRKLLAVARRMIVSRSVDLLLAHGLIDVEQARAVHIAMGVVDFIGGALSAAEENVVRAEEALEGEALERRLAETERQRAAERGISVDRLRAEWNADRTERCHSAGYMTADDLERLADRHAGWIERPQLRSPAALHRPLRRSGRRASRRTRRTRRAAARAAPSSDGPSSDPQARAVRASVVP